MDLLEDKQLAPFRKEYLEREKEIQRYIGVYLSGVVIVFGWIIGPQSKPLNAMALGNDGYNIFAFLVISIVNALFITFLIYKSLDVHDTTQFIAILAHPKSIYTFWEKWRRSRHSVTKPVRIVYFIALALLPALMALTLLLFTGSKIFASEESLRNQLAEIEGTPVREATAGPIDAQANPPAPDFTDVDVKLARVRSVFRIAAVVFVVVCLMHSVPIWFFIYNTAPTKKKWDAVVELKKAQSRDCSPRSDEARELEKFFEDPAAENETNDQPSANGDDAI